MAVADDVDVWVNPNQGGTWSHPIDSTGNGSNVLGDIGSGGVGLAANGLAAGGSVVCDYLRVGADGDADHDLADANEAVIDDSFSSVQVTLGYDAAGNLTDDGVYQYVYDAWNRLVQVKRKGGSQAVVATYRYDGLGHRVYKKVENSGDMNREEYYYYNQKWQLLEIDNADNLARQQFVWGTNYIDEAICMDVDTDTSGPGYGDCTDSGGSRHFFYMQDANWNVVALREGTTIVERYEYDPYGTVRIYRGSPSSGAPEQRTVTGQSLKWLNASLPSNPVLYAGYFHDNETGLYHVRHRMLGRDRWMQRDPGPDGTGPVQTPVRRRATGNSLGNPAKRDPTTFSGARPKTGPGLAQYEDGPNLYVYVSDAPTVASDPTGRVKWTPYTDTGKDWSWDGDDGDLLRASTDAGSTIITWKPHHGNAYWCHGYTFDGYNAAGGPFSTGGIYVPVILSDEWERIHCCMAHPTDILVFWAEGAPFQPPYRYPSASHSGKITTVVVNGGKVDENASMLRSKWGHLPLNTQSWLVNAREYGKYRCYTKKGNPVQHGCCIPGDNEAPDGWPGGP